MHDHCALSELQQRHVSDADLPRLKTVALRGTNL